jgi:hypothetical protein
VSPAGSHGSVEVHSVMSASSPAAQRSRIGENQRSRPASTLT